MKKIEPCSFCGQQFDNVFEMADHFMDDNEQPEFDPYYILPNGYKLMLGSLLRTLYEKAEDKEKIQYIVQDTFLLLFASEHNPKEIKKMIEDTIVEEHMSTFDEDFKRLFGGKE